MNDLTNEMLARLDAIALKMGILAGDLWEVVVMQCYLNGWIKLTAGVGATVFFLGLGITLFYRFEKALVKAAAADTRLTEDRCACYLIPACVSTIGGLIAFGVTACSLSPWLTRIFNPEFHALHYLLEHLN